MIVPSQNEKGVMLVRFQHISEEWPELGTPVCKLKSAILFFNTDIILMEEYARLF